MSNTAKTFSFLISPEQKLTAAEHFFANSKDFIPHVHTHI